MVLTVSMGISGQEPGLKDKRITIQMTDKPLITVFARLMYKYDVAIGFEESDLDRDHRHYEFETNVPSTDESKVMYGGDKEYSHQHSSALGTKPRKNLITVNFKDAKLEQVMDEIVKQMQNYDWRISDDVVNIFPIRGRDERLKKLLDIKVRDFAVGMGADVGSIQAQLMLFLPEFKKFVTENKLEADTGRLTFNFSERILPDGMRFHDKTFKELLNAITKSKRGGWIIKIKKHESKPDKEFIEILI